MKDTVKSQIEEFASGWSEEERDQCVGATAATFKFAGSINRYLSGGASPH